MVGVARGGGCRTRMAQAGSTTGQTREPLSKPLLQTARTATLEAFTPTRTHAHHTNRRGVFYLRREAHGPPTDRPCMPLAFDVLGAQTTKQILISNLEESRTTLEE